MKIKGSSTKEKEERHRETEMPLLGTLVFLGSGVCSSSMD